MLIDLHGRTALVTGSTVGIGYAIAAGLLEAGATVVVNGRTQERVDKAVASLGGGDRLRGAAADLSTAQGCAELTGALPEVDILVNNAAIFEPEVGVFDIPDADWERFFAINVMSGVRLSRHYLPPMMKRGWGRVTFVSSEAAVNVPASMVHYGMTKTAQLALARGLAESVSRSGVTVNSVLPGPTRTEGLEALLQSAVGNGADSFAAAAEGLMARTLTGRIHSPEEVANMVVYLSSNQASAITGTAVKVDGGVVHAVT